MTILPSYSKFIDCHKGEHAFIVGSGTSIYNKDISFIQDHVVCCVNSSIMLMPWSNGSKSKRYWLSNDSGVMAWSYWKDVLSSHSNKIVRSSWNHLYNKFDTSDFSEFKIRPTPENEVNPNDTGLAYCSSVPSSLDFAIQSGCKKIFLLGVDQYQYKGKSHFWQFYPKDKQPKRWMSNNPNSFKSQQYAFGFNELAYDALKGFADYSECKIYNCNPISRIDYFDKISIEEAKEIAAQ